MSDKEIYVNPDKLQNPLSHLRMGDLDEFRKITGMSFEEGLQPDILRDPDGKPMRDENRKFVRAENPPVDRLSVFFYLILRLDNPWITLKTIKDLSLEDFMTLCGQAGLGDENGSPED